MIDGSVPKITELFKGGAGIRDPVVISQPGLLWVSFGNGKKIQEASVVAPDPCHPHLCTSE